MNEDIDKLVGQLSLQDFRSARGGLYKALAELRELRAQFAAARAYVEHPGNWPAAYDERRNALAYLTRVRKP